VEILPTQNLRAEHPVGRTEVRRLAALCHLKPVTPLLYNKQGSEPVATS
jgi:hypothetical protein